MFFTLQAFHLSAAKSRSISKSVIRSVKCEPVFRILYSKLVNRCDPLLCTIGQKQYTCPTCGKTFRFWGGLDDCLRRHHGSLRHSCTLCDKGFNSKFRLLLHQRTHSGARPFQCPCCAYDCARRDNLLTHIRRSHKLTQAEAVLLGNQRFLKETDQENNVAAEQAEDDVEDVVGGEVEEKVGDEVEDEINLEGDASDQPLDMSGKVITE